MSLQFSILLHRWTWTSSSAAPLPPHGLPYPTVCVDRVLEKNAGNINKPLLGRFCWGSEPKCAQKHPAPLTPCSVQPRSRVLWQSMVMAIRLSSDVKAWKLLTWAILLRKSHVVIHWYCWNRLYNQLLITTKNHWTQNDSRSQPKRLFEVRPKPTHVQLETSCHNISGKTTWWGW